MSDIASIAVIVWVVFGISVMTYITVEDIRLNKRIKKTLERVEHEQIGRNAGK